MLATLLFPDVVLGRHVLLMFQDEARFGRMVRIRRCWSPTPLRPVVDNGYERQFQYVYGAVSPLEGEFIEWSALSVFGPPRTAVMGKKRRQQTKSIAS